MDDTPAKPRAKVCILTTVHVPFDGRIFHKQAKTLAKAGYDVVLIATHDKAEVVDGVRVVPLGQAKSRRRRMTVLTRRLLRLAITERADVYHFHDPELIGVGLVLKVLRKKVIWDVHEHYPNAIIDKFWISKGLRRAVSKAFDLFERAVVRFFDYVIFTPPIVGARYERSKVRSGSVENYPIIALSQSPENERSDTMIYLGAMSRARGLVEAVEAFARVVKQHPTWKLSLVGSARPAVFAEELKALAKQRGAGVHVEFVPWVPYDEKERLSSEASIGLVTYLPYSNNTSCLANKLFDYMLVGLPVIASDFPLYRQVVETSRCGLLVDPASPAAIAEAMNYLIEHPDEAREMGANGQRAVLERYNWDVESKKLLSIYETVLSKHGGS